MLLQANLGVFEHLAEYGVLGLVTLALGFVVWYLLRRELAFEDKLRVKADELQREITSYIKEDRDRVTTALNNNTEALNHLRDSLRSKM